MQYRCNNNTVYNAAQHYADKAVFKAAGAKKHFADNNGRKADNDCAGAHADIGKAVVLRNQRAA